MQAGQKRIIILIAIFIAVLSLIYLLVYNQGFKTFFNQTKEISSSCETNAEKQAREDLKPKYGDALSRDFVLGSPHYKNRYNQCQSEKEKK